MSDRDRIVSDPNGRYQLTAQPDGRFVAYDLHTGKTKVLADFSADADPPPIPPIPPPGPLTPKLRIEGTRFETITGEPFVYRGITAFSLLAVSSEVTIPYLDYARGAGFNVVRALSCVLNDFADLAPEEGVRRLPMLLSWAQERGLYVRVVALSDTQTFADAGRGFDWRQHARNVATVCAMHENAIFDFANEPYHGTHVPELHNMAHAQAEAAVATDGLDVLWATGASPSDEAIIPGGRYIERHLDRGRDYLNQVRRVRELHGVQEEAGVPVLNGEPLGAHEVKTSNRTDEPWFFYAMGALEALFGVAGTFHCEAGLRCTVPGPVTQTCAQAYLDGKRIVPAQLQGRLIYKNNEHDGSPVAGANLEDPGSDSSNWSPIQDPNGGPIVRAYSGILGDEGWTVVLSRPEGHDGVGDLMWAWQHGPNASLFPHVQVYAVSQ